MSLQDIIAAAASQNALTARINAFMDGLGDIEDRLETFDGLAENLVDVVRRQMHFVGTVDPDIAEPTGVSGGTFQTLKQLVDAAPVGASVEARLVAGKTHLMASDITLISKFLLITKAGAGANPVLKPSMNLTTGQNMFARFSVQYTSSSIFLFSVNVDLTAPKVDAGLPWFPNNALIQSGYGGVISVGAYACSITSDDSNKFGVYGQNVALGLTSITLNGAFSFTKVSAGQVLSIARSNVTLNGGATIFNGTSAGSVIGG